MYFGEREGVMPFFNSVGFQLPARKGIADFLQEVTSPKDQPVRALLASSFWRTSTAIGPI